MSRAVPSLSLPIQRLFPGSWRRHRLPLPGIRRLQPPLRAFPGLYFYFINYWLCPAGASRPRDALRMWEDAPSSRLAPLPQLQAGWEDLQPPDFPFPSLSGPHPCWKNGDREPGWHHQSSWNAADPRPGDAPFPLSDDFPPFPRSPLGNGATCSPKMLPRCPRVPGSCFSTPCPGPTAPTCSSAPTTPSSTTPPRSFMVRWAPGRAWDVQGDGSWGEKNSGQPLNSHFLRCCGCRKGTRGCLSISCSRSVAAGGAEWMKQERIK